MESEVAETKRLLLSLMRDAYEQGRDLVIDDQVYRITPEGIDNLKREAEEFEKQVGYDA